MHPSHEIAKLRRLEMNLLYPRTIPFATVRLINPAALGGYPTVAPSPSPSPLGYHSKEWNAGSGEDNTDSTPHFGVVIISRKEAEAMRLNYIHASKIHRQAKGGGRRGSPRLVIALLTAALLFPLVPTICRADAAWGPNNKYVVVSSGGGGSLYKVNVDGSGSSRIVGTDSGVSPSLSPDGRYILYDMPVTGNSLVSSKLMLLDSVTGKAIAIGQNVTVPFAWRDDSSRFAGMQQGLTQFSAWFYLLSAKGVTLKVKFPPAVTIFDRAIWLPHTDNIAYLAGVQPPVNSAPGTPPMTDVYTVEYGVVNKISTSGDVLGLGMTPDGKNLLWARRGKNLRYILLTLYEFNLDKRTIQRLPFEEEVSGINSPRRAPNSIGAVSFSPDGKRLAVECFFNMPTNAGGNPTGNLNTNSPKSIAGNGQGTQGAQNVQTPNPSGSVTQSGVISAVYIISIDGTQSTKVISKVNETFSFAWSHNSDMLAIKGKSTSGNDTELWVCSADGSNLRTLLSSKTPSNQ